jgi:hypothetical protein
MGEPVFVEADGFEGSHAFAPEMIESSTPLADYQEE